MVLMGWRFGRAPSRCIVTPPERSGHRERDQIDVARGLRLETIGRTRKNSPAGRNRPHGLDLAGGAEPAHVLPARMAVDRRHEQVLPPRGSKREVRRFAGRRSSAHRIRRRPGAELSHHRDRSIERRRVAIARSGDRLARAQTRLIRAKPQNLNARRQSVTVQ
jgi:hypothetical protein